MPVFTHPKQFYNYRIHAQLQFTKPTPKNTKKFHKKFTILNLETKPKKKKKQISITAVENQRNQDT